MLNLRKRRELSTRRAIIRKDSKMFKKMMMALAVILGLVGCIFIRPAFAATGGAAPTQLGPATQSVQSDDFVVTTVTYCAPRAQYVWVSIVSKSGTIRAGVSFNGRLGFAVMGPNWSYDIDEGQTALAVRAFPASEVGLVSVLVIDADATLNPGLPAVVQLPSMGCQV